MGEFRRPFDTFRLMPGKPVQERLAADAAERAALAARFGLSAIEVLRADVTVDRRRDGAVRVRGHWTARYTQLCVVTLEPFELARDDAIDTLFLDMPADGDGVEAIVAPDEGDVEPLTGRMVDLGELVAQMFGVQIDPYPRSPAAGEAQEADAGDASGAGPFAQLKDLVIR